MIDRDRFAVSHNQHMIGNNLDFTRDSQIFGLDNRFAAQLQTSRNWITFKQMDDGGFPQDSVAVVAPDPGLYGAVDFDTRNSRLDDVAGSFEDRLKLTSALALIGGVRLEDLTLARNGINADGTFPDRAAVHQVLAAGVLPRGLYLRADPRPDVLQHVRDRLRSRGRRHLLHLAGKSLQLTSSRIYETGAKQLFWDGKAEWTVAAYDILQRNVFVPVNTTTTDLAGEVASKGIELAAAVRPFDGWKLWANAAYTHARFVNFDVWTGNTPPNVAPVIVNAGASYRFNHWRWPVEFGGSVRHVGDRYLFPDNLTTLDAYTTADVYAFVDIPGRDLARAGPQNLRVTFRVRNVTDKVYAAVVRFGPIRTRFLLGAPRTYEIAASARW